MLDYLSVILFLPFFILQGQLSSKNIPNNSIGQVWEETLVQKNGLEFRLKGKRLCGGSSQDL